MGNSATFEVDVVGGVRSGRARRLRGAIRPWLTPKVAVGSTIVVILIVVGALAPWISPYDPNGQNLARVVDKNAVAPRPEHAPALFFSLLV